MASKHPISQGLSRYLKLQNEHLEANSLDEIREVPARGVAGRRDGKMIAGGNALFMEELGLNPNYSSENSLYYVAYNNVIVAVYELRDQPKHDAKDAIDALRMQGLKVAMLTGDHESVAQRVADEVGISDIYWGLSPQDKAHFIAKAREAGEIIEMAVFIGPHVCDESGYQNAAE